MFSKDWTTSIEKPPGSSVGALLTPFIKGLALDQLSGIDPGTETTVVQWFNELAEGGTVAHHLVYSPTEIAPRYPGAVLLRILCHYLVDSVPDRALPEIAESTLSVFEHHQVPRHSLVYSVPGQQRLPAAQGRTFESPGFQIEPE
jgi:hypothetical protein